MAEEKLSNSPSTPLVIKWKLGRGTVKPFTFNRADTTADQPTR